MPEFDLLLNGKQRTGKWTYLSVASLPGYKSLLGKGRLTLNILMETRRPAVGNIVRLEFERESELEMRESGIWWDEQVIQCVSFSSTQIEGP
jgi:hypothetical protein